MALLLIAIQPSAVANRARPGDVGQNRQMIGPVITRYGIVLPAPERARAIFIFGDEAGADFE